jgi:hypothetical protein
MWNAQYVSKSPFVDDGLEPEDGLGSLDAHREPLYQKLGARNRMEAVERARSLGLLTPSSRRP